MTLDTIRNFAANNRGLLLDIFVFLVNLLLMRFLAGIFVNLIKGASNDQPAAQFVIFAMLVGMFVLPPAGATLKRYHFQRRVSDSDAGVAFGCFFNPIFYFCLMAVIFSAINAFLMEYIFGREDPGGAFFASSMFIGLALMVTHTYLVYRYFSKPKGEPKFAFLKDPRAELLGDLCVWVNMILFQLFWNLLSFEEFSRPGSVGEAIGRLGLLIFLALLVYFPPRIFYLAEDIRRPVAWLTILLANSPIIVRLLVGTDPGQTW